MLLTLLSACFLNSTAVAPAEAQSTAPLYFAPFTHMEGSLNDVNDQALFNQHTQQIRCTMDQFEARSAWLTIESAPTFATACTKWGVNVLKEVRDRRHGVGTHVDFGANDALTSVATYANKYTTPKAKVDGLVGAAHNLGISGGFGVNEWVKAPELKGFKYVDGVVGLGYLSMPISARPDATWTDAWIRSTGFKRPSPVDFAERIKIYKLLDATNFTPDVTGTFTVIGGTLGGLDGLAEGNTCGTTCVFNQADIDFVLASIDQANAVRDLTQPATMDVHIPLRLLDAADRPMLNSFVDQVQAYAALGKVTWTTKPAIYHVVSGTTPPPVDPITVVPASPCP